MSFLAPLERIAQTLSNGVLQCFNDAASLPSGLGASAYSETTAVSNLALAVSAYCGAPKYNSTFLTGWDCGPSCKGAPTVTDITTFHDFSLGIFGLVGRYNNHCLVDFRGTYDAAGWETDFKGATLAPFKVDSSCSGCEAGAGFLHTL